VITFGLRQSLELAPGTIGARDFSPSWVAGEGLPASGAASACITAEGLKLGQADKALLLLGASQPAVSPLGKSRLHVTVKLTEIPVGAI